MSQNTPEDFVALEVRAVPQTSDAGPLHWDFYYVLDPGPYRLNFVGFSFFGELGSYLPDGSSNEYIQIEKSALNDPGDCNYSVVVTDPPPLSFSNSRWLKMLSCRRLNFTRVFIFPAYKEVRYFPFTKVSGLYDLRSVSDDYKSRLTDYLLKAKEHGTVVCLSLFADQMLRINTALADDAFLRNPFRNALNTGDTNFISIDLNNDDDNDIRTRFYSISEPKITPKAPLGWASLHDQAAWASWTDSEKMYAVQRNLVTEIVNATRPHWNVMYEVSNEPRSTNDAALAALTLEWIKKVAGWLDDLLWDQVNSKHKRLIMVDLQPPSDVGSFRAQVLSALRKDDFHLKVDVFSFHGTEWNADSLANNISALGNIDILAQSGWPARKLRNFPLAIIFDTDANHAAQSEPASFLKAVRAAHGNFNYRWSDVSTLTHRLEQLNRANPPAGFAMTSANKIVTYHWETVPQADGYVITLSQADPPYGPTSIALPAPLKVNGGTTNQTQVSYPNVFGARATIKATMPARPGFSAADSTGESAGIKVYSGTMMDCEVTGSILPSGKLSSLQYTGSITLRNLGFAPWTLYRPPETPGRQLTFAVRVDVYDNPQGTGWIANGQWFLLQPQDSTKFVRTGESSTFQISYLLPNRPGQMYLIFNFDQYVIGPGAQTGSSRIKTLLTRLIQVQ
jgi:hypothetical protein